MIIGVAAKIRAGNIPNKIQNHNRLSKFDPSTFYKLISKNQIFARILAMRKKKFHFNYFAHCVAFKYNGRRTMISIAESLNYQQRKY
jgi:hypothetical protein